MELRIKVLGDELEQSKKTLKKAEHEVMNKKAIIDALSKEEKEAKVRFEKVQEELRLIADHIQSQEYSVYWIVIKARGIKQRLKR